MLSESFFPKSMRFLAMGLQTSVTVQGHTLANSFLSSSSSKNACAPTPEPQPDPMPVTDLSKGQ